MGQWYEQPEEDAPLFGANETKAQALWKRALWFAVMYAMIAGAVLLVAMLAGCTYSGPWKATYRLEIKPQAYKGKVIPGKIYETNASDNWPDGSSVR